MLVQRRLLVLVDHARGTQQLRVVVAVVRQVGGVAVELELQAPLAPAHAAPAIEQDTADHHDTDDDQPFAQTDVHERHIPLIRIRAYQLIAQPLHAGLTRLYTGAACNSP
ncbi:hypothetical protein D9M71_491140 [compost metagenome]